MEKQIDSESTQVQEVNPTCQEFGVFWSLLMWDAKLNQRTEHRRCINSICELSHKIKWENKPQDGMFLNVLHRFQGGSFRPTCHFVHFSVVYLCGMWNQTKPKHPFCSDLIWTNGLTGVKASLDISSVQIFQWNLTRPPQNLKSNWISSERQTVSAVIWRIW